MDFACYLVSARSQYLLGYFNWFAAEKIMGNAMNTGEILVSCSIAQKTKVAQMVLGAL